MFYNFQECLAFSSSAMLCHVVVFPFIENQLSQLWIKTRMYSRTSWMSQLMVLLPSTKTQFYSAVLWTFQCLFSKAFHLYFENRNLCQDSRARAKRIKIFIIFQKKIIFTEFITLYDENQQVPNCNTIKTICKISWIVRAFW